MGDYTSHARKSLNWRSPKCGAQVEVNEYPDNPSWQRWGCGCHMLEIYGPTRNGSIKEWNKCRCRKGCMELKMLEKDKESGECRTNQ